MQINGNTLDNTDAIYGPVIIRRGKKLHGFYAQPVWSYDSFHAACPTPEAPVSAFGKGGKKQHDVKNPIYLEALKKYGRQQWGYLVLVSLQPTKLDLSKQGVSLDDPETWHKVEDALTYSESNPNGLSHYEFKQVMDLIEEANLLDPEKMETNLESFLLEAARQAEPGDNSQNGEAGNTACGERVKDGE